MKYLSAASVVTSGLNLSMIEELDASCCTGAPAAAAAAGGACVEAAQPAQLDSVPAE